MMKNMNEQYPLMRAINLASIDDIFKVIEMERAADIPNRND